MPWHGEGARLARQIAARAIIPASLIFASESLPQSILRGVSLDVGHVSAAELKIPLEQAAVSDERKEASDLAKALEAGDFDRAISFLDGSFSPASLGIRDGQFRLINLERAQEILVKASAIPPVCAGMLWEGRNVNHPTLFFRNFILDGRSQIVAIHLNANHSQMRATIERIEAVNDRQFTAVKDKLEKCSELIQSNESLIKPSIQPSELDNPRRKTVAIVPGLIHEQSNGQLVGELTDHVIGKLIDEGGYHLSDFVVPNLVSGGRYSPNGFYLPADQPCDITLRGEQANGEQLAQSFKDLGNARPNDEIVIVTHSLGSTYTMNALERLLEENSPVLSQIKKIIFTDGPNLGMKKDILQFMSKLWSWRRMPGNCQWLFGIPFPASFKYQALIELKDNWQNKDLTVRRRSKMVVPLKERGTKVISLGSVNDCVMDDDVCMLDGYEFERAIIWGGDNVTIYTQTLPGAENRMERLGHGDLLGHVGFWREEGSEILTSYIGEQQVKGPRR
jgi:pimeloyl-ACP methyl ester carboxylesterase